MLDLQGYLLILLHQIIVKASEVAQLLLECTHPTLKIFFTALQYFSKLILVLVLSLKLFAFVL